MVTPPDHRPPQGMSAPIWSALRRMPSAARDRVLERAAIYHFDGGLPLHEADRRALDEELQRT